MYAILIVLLIIYYLWNPAEAFGASQDGLQLWFQQVLPTLLPFTIISAIIIGSNLLYTLDCRMEALPIKLPVSITEAFIIFFGFLFGFPIGSKLTADHLEHDMISAKSAQVLCAFTNNLSPVCIMSYVLQQQFHGKYPVLPVLLLLYGPPFVIGMIQLLHIPSRKCNHKKTASRFQINMQIVDAGIISGFHTLIKLCGYIVMFSIIGNMATHIPWQNPQIQCLFISNLEVTNGIYLVAQYPSSDVFQFICMILVLSIGGVSGIAQTGSMISNTNLSIMNYVLLRLGYCLCSVILGFGYYFLFV